MVGPHLALEGKRLRLSTEVVGMYRTLLGDDKFRQGTDLYFDRHDGQAATTDDFMQAMSDAGNI